MLQASEQAVETLEITFSSRLLQLTRQPLQLPSDPETLHGYFHLTSMLFDVRDQELAIPLARQDEHTISMTQMRM